MVAREPCVTRHLVSHSIVPLIHINVRLSLTILLLVIAHNYLPAQSRLTLLNAHYVACWQADDVMALRADGMLVSILDDRIALRGYLELPWNEDIVEACHFDGDAIVLIPQSRSRVYMHKAGSLVDSISAPSVAPLTSVIKMGTRIALCANDGTIVITQENSLEQDTTIIVPNGTTLATNAAGFTIAGRSFLQHIEFDNDKVTDNILIPYPNVGSIDQIIVSADIQHTVLSIARDDGNYLLLKVRADSTYTILDTSRSSFALSTHHGGITAVSSSSVWSITNERDTAVATNLLAAGVYYFAPNAVVQEDSVLHIAGENSLIATVHLSGQSTVLSYMRSFPFTGFRLQGGNQQRVCIMTTPKNVPLVMGPSPFEWRPVGMRGTCVVEGASSQGMYVMSDNSIISTWMSLGSNTTIWNPGTSELTCTENTLTKPSLWTTNRVDTIVGISPTTKQFVISTDRGMAWTGFAPLDINSSSVSTMHHAIGGIVWIVATAIDSTLDTTIYRSTAYRQLLGYRNGSRVYTYSFPSISSIRSPVYVGDTLFCLARSNVNSDTTPTTFGYFDHALGTFQELLTNSESPFNCACINGRYAFLSMNNGAVAVFDIWSRKRMDDIIVEQGWTTVFEEIAAINDSTLIGTTFSNPKLVYLIDIGSTTTGVHDDPYKHLQIAAINGVWPNPSTSTLNATLTVANGWPVDDIHVSVTNVIGSTAANYTLQALGVVSFGDAPFTVRIPCQQLPAGCYVLSVHSSRGVHSRTFVKM